MKNIKRICLWSGPRNISTALMYSFAQRLDTKVFDEPLYAHYLSSMPSVKNYHPVSDQILTTMDNNGRNVVDLMLSNEEKPVLFFKNMTHHLVDLDWSFMKETINIILTRDPVEMLPSFDKVIPNPNINDVGYAMHKKLLDYFLENNIPFSVLDAKQVLLDPEAKLKKLCEEIGISFQENMLQWEPQRRPEDGIWAPYWYKSVHESTGFYEYQAKNEPFPDHLKPLLKETQTYYSELLKLAI